MIPLAVSRGIGSATNRSISTAIIGGQMLALLLTLVAIPVFYSLFDDLEKTGITKAHGRADSSGISRKEVIARL